jgi:hypothetical protein
MQFERMPPQVPDMFQIPLGVYQGYPFRVRKSYGAGAEARAVNEEIGDFDFHQSPVMADLERSFGPNVRVKELKSIIRTIRLWLQHRSGVDLPKPSRNTMRSFPLMVKYLETHYADVAPVLRVITLCDESKNPLHATPDSD